jgi:hypothetical protein
MGSRGEEENREIGLILMFDGGGDLVLFTRRRGGAV